MSPLAIPSAELVNDAVTAATDGFVLSAVTKPERQHPFTKPALKARTSPMIIAAFLETTWLLFCPLPPRWILPQPPLGIDTTAWRATDGSNSRFGTPSGSDDVTNNRGCPK